MNRPPLQLSEFNVNLRKHVDPGSPKPLRLMAAKGLVPMAPQEMALVLYQLDLDSDPKVRDTSRQSIQEAPAEVIETALTSPLPGSVLDWLADLLGKDPAAAEHLVTNQATPDDTIARLAKSASAGLADLIAENQVRLLRHPDIIEALYMNPAARMSTVDRIVDLARRNGVALDGLPALRPLLESQQPIVDDAAAHEEIEAIDAQFGQFLVESLIEEETLAEREPDDEESHVAEDRSHKDRISFLSNLRVPQRIRFAILGSREDRSILIRDANRLVQVAAVSSPKANEQDAIVWSGNRSLSESVITYICDRRDWFRNYQIKVNLANNPKLPLRKAIGILPHLHHRDLTNLARNRNVSHQLTRQAKALGVKRKTGRGR